MTIKVHSTIWVCVDCMLTHANGECGENPDREPLSQLDGWDYAMGGEHDPACAQEGECDCGHVDFSWSACEGCGSSLGGDRYMFTLFARP